MAVSSARVETHITTRVAQTSKALGVYFVERAKIDLLGAMYFVTVEYCQVSVDISLG